MQTFFLVPLSHKIAMPRISNREFVNQSFTGGLGGHCHTNDNVAKWVIGCHSTENSSGRNVVTPAPTTSNVLENELNSYDIFFHLMIQC
jgi:hypothetical protein